MDFEKLLIKTGKYWDLKIHHSQNCLGKCLLWYKGDPDKDLLEISEEEQKEFWEIATNAKKALDKLSTPDKYNYLCAGNRTPHLHFYIIPRYKEKRVLGGIEFKDVDFGDFPKSSNEVDEGILFKIRDEIKNAF